MPRRPALVLGLLLSLIACGEPEEPSRATGAGLDVALPAADMAEPIPDRVLSDALIVLVPPRGPLLATRTPGGETIPLTGEEGSLAMLRREGERAGSWDPTDDRGRVETTVLLTPRLEVYYAHTRFFGVR